MSTPNRGFDERMGPRRGRALLLVLAVLSLLVIVTVSAWLVLDGLRHERSIQSIGIGVLSLMAILLWLRIVRARWLSLQVQTYVAPSASEETGVWGVGGPGMRTPGATGIYTALQGGGRIDDPPGEGPRPR
ncbi:MAG TPA: hypothetical protein VNZ06_13485 [Steroidobacteraceae bacterium]|jgi:hypothetical protein|nr:hypothetical protein [Steroidobacteraceae bacterium]